MKRNNFNSTGSLNPNASAFFSNNISINSSLMPHNPDLYSYPNSYYYPYPQYQSLDHNYSEFCEGQNEDNIESDSLNIYNNGNAFEDPYYTNNKGSKYIGDKNLYNPDESPTDRNSNKKNIKGKSYQALRQEKRLYNSKKNDSYIENSGYSSSREMIDTKIHSNGNDIHKYESNISTYNKFNERDLSNNKESKSHDNRKNNSNDFGDNKDYKKYNRDRAYLFERNSQNNIKEFELSKRKNNYANSKRDRIFAGKDAVIEEKDIAPKNTISKRNRFEDEEYYVKIESSKYNETDDHQIFNNKFKNKQTFKDSKKLDIDITVNQNGIIKFKKENWMEENQRELLIEQLSFGNYECMVCFYSIKKDTAVWNCCNCFHVFHLYCIKKWAKSSIDEETKTWRCPGCQNLLDSLPRQYVCYCGKRIDPEYNAHMTPHSCGEMCGKERAKNCIHPCNILCHPGPCPPCHAYVNQKCKCGKKSFSMKCHLASSTTCDAICNKVLNCGKHTCDVVCHDGACLKCSVSVQQICFCGRKERVVECGSKEAFLNSYSCEEKCDKILSCNNHNCNSKCHPGPCELCPLSPEVVSTCPCGKTKLIDLTNNMRLTCLDEIPTCNKICDMVLQCSQPDNEHLCPSICHNSKCPPCSKSTIIECRCGHEMTTMTCLEASKFNHEAPFKCSTRCNKKMSCGRHKCSELCCDLDAHVCALICSRKLSCGLHKCDELCHKNICKPCWQVSFDELKCECGAEKIYPPVQCGTKPPECHRPCSRKHPCNHKVAHNCHTEPTCPNCTILVERMCMGGHEIRRNIPCYLEDVSCGKACGRKLSCAMHFCLTICHKDDCLEKTICKQACTRVREACGHPCSAPCHPLTACPNSPCKMEVFITCECGRRKEKVLCLNSTTSLIDFEKANIRMVANKLWESQSISVQRNNSNTKRLPCDSECAKLERNKRLALALEIKNPDLNGKLGNPNYSVFLKQFAKSNLAFVADVEKTLADLVIQTQQMKAGKKCHSFKVMPSQQRKFVHELASLYGCETMTYDEEPNKNVVVTAIKDKCWLPNVTLTSNTQRDLFPKAPTPIPINCKEEQLRSAAIAAKQSTQVYIQENSSSNKQPPKSYTRRIDYFDYESD